MAAFPGCLCRAIQAIQGHWHSAEQEAVANKNSAGCSWVEVGAAEAAAAR